ncbi:MAG TPA: GvpL/GvpF family gas vesicle protein [Ktedonobacteraceae bacterium]|jgi:hypothetical protein
MRSQHLMHRKEREVESVTTSGIYIYGIIPASGPGDFGDIGIGDCRVRTIVCGQVAAVCSESPLVVYETLARERTVRDLVVHQRVIEKVMSACTILPVKFGTMVTSEQEVGDFLHEGSVLLAATLAEMQGQVELDVIASWELSRVLPQLYRKNRQLQEKQQEIAQSSQGVGLEEKVALGKLVSQALAEHRAHYRQQLLQVLARAATDTCLHGVVGDDMILNAAFLLQSRRQERFHELVQGLDQRLEDALNFRVVGPLPPYSFATILFERVDAAKLEEARTLFGCHGELTKRLVRDTYHQLVRRYHPDSGSEADARQFHLVQSAYRTLHTVLAGGQLHVSIYQWENDPR